MSSELTTIGKKLPWPYGPAIVTGKAIYTADIYLPGMLYAKVLRSPHPHARIVKIDATEAEKLEGVETVLTWKNVPRIKYNTAEKNPPNPQTFVYDQYILDEYVRFVGDQVAFVAAESEEIAEKALNLIEVEYELLPAVFDPEQAMKPEAPKVHESGNITGEIPLSVGDIAKGFKEADFVFEDKYKLPIQHSLPLEPHVSVAGFDEVGNLTIWTSTQTPFLVRTKLSKLLDIQLNKVRVIVPNIGGSFGSKQDMVSEQIVALLALRTGKPVKIIFHCEEMFYASRTRHSGMVYLKTGVKKDGTFTARQCRMIYNTGAYASCGLAVLDYGAWEFFSLYKCPNLDLKGYCIYTNIPVAGAFRGYGTPQVNFAVESQVDMIAKELSMDPIEIRLKNIPHQGDTDPLIDEVIRSCGLQECIEKGAEAIGWLNKRKNGKQGVKRRGVGMAIFTLCSGTKPALPEFASAIVKFNENGTVNLLHGISDMGMGARTTLAMIAAEVLGMPLDDIVTCTLDTSSAPYDKGTHASRVTYVGGNAVKLAALRARERLLNCASEKLRVSKEDLDIKDRTIFVKSNPSINVSITNAVNFATFGKEPEAIIGEATVEPVYNAPSFGANFAEVEVDMNTGELKVLRLVSPNDLGKVINPFGARGQIEGGLIGQGLGYAITEEQIIDHSTGKLLNTDLKGYKMTSPVDIPDVDVIYVESMEPTGPFGAKGCSENCMVSIGATIANAVYNATGLRIKELPITKNKILKAIKIG